MVLTMKDGEVDRLMREGKDAAKRGDKVMARALLTQLLERDPDNEKAWMWLSGAVEDPFEQQTCLENVLIINPFNAQALKGLQYITTKTGSPSQVLANLTANPPTQPAQQPSAAGADYYANTAPIDGSLLPEALRGEMPPLEQKGGTETLTEVADGISPVDAEVAFPNYAEAVSVANTAGAVMPDTAYPTGSEALADAFDGLMPFQPETQSGVGAGVHDVTPSQGGMPGLEWLNPEPAHEPAGNIPQAIEQPEVAAANTHPALDIFGPGAPSGFPMPSGDVDGDLGALLGQIGADAPPAPGMPKFAHDPFGTPDFSSMDPFGSSQLPSPSDLPGGGSSEAEQPWYLRASSTNIAEPPDTSYGGGPGDEGFEGDQHAASTLVMNMDCPYCHTQVPETSLACPQCRFTFFVHCPYCHELVDTGDAKMGVSEPCPYCRVQINKMELGLINAGGITNPTVADPVEDKDAWMGKVSTEPQTASANIGWLVDLMWLMAIVLMVWALTQLPGWFNLTDLYS